MRRFGTLMMMLVCAACSGRAQIRPEAVAASAAEVSASGFSLAVAALPDATACRDAALAHHLSLAVAARLHGMEVSWSLDDSLCGAGDLSGPTSFALEWRDFVSDLVSKIPGVTPGVVAELLDDISAAGDLP